MDDETTQGGSEHHKCHSSVHLVFGKEKKHSVALFKDNTSTNRVCSLHFGRFFVERSSHHFKLADKYLLSERQLIIKKRPWLVKRISYSIPAALLK